MSTYLHPGVYIEEIPSGSRPIEGVSTSVTAFVGPAQRGPAREATLIQKLDDYISEYGRIASENDAMGFAVQAFYLNGGRAAYICRLVGDGSTAATTAFPGEDTGGANVLNVTASSEGEWGNAYYVRIIKSDPAALTFTLEIGKHNKDGEFEVEETFANLAMREDDPNYALTVVNEDSLLVRLSLVTAIATANYQGATVRGGELDDSDGDYFSDAATAATGFWTLTLNINQLGTRQISLNPATLGLTGGNHDGDANILRNAITSAVRNLGTSAAYQLFACTYDTVANRFVLTVPQSNSNATLEVYGGSLASVLRLDTDAVAELTGSAVANTATHFSNGFAALATDADRTLTLNIDNRGNISITLAASDVTLLGASNTTDGEALARAVQDAVQAYDPRVEAYKNFTCTYDTLQFTLTSGSSTPRQSGLTVSDSGLAALMGLAATDTPTLGRELDQGSAQVIPIQNLGPLDAGVTLAGVAVGTEFAPTANTYADFYNQTLRKVRDVSIIVLPGQTWADDGSGNAAISQTLAFAATYQRMMVIIDPPEDLELDQAVTVNTMGLPTSTYAVLYYPWVEMANPLFNIDTNPTAPRFVAVAPSAFAAGMWAKIDGKRGVWKAPAGVETQLLGAGGLQFNVEDGEQDQLNPLGVNCIRKLPGFGSVFWGSRTLATRADPEWRYVPVRRTAIFIEQSIYNGIQWAVFEPNDHPLWSALRSNIGAFMDGLFRAGAFQGATANDAYFVRCGLGDTMTQGDIDRGQVIVIVGFAPLKPAEFVIVRIQQKVGEQ
jgi:hypothetical protein